MRIPKCQLSVTGAALCGALLASVSNGGEGPSASVAGETTIDEVVVTGSRVIANGNDSPTPVTVVTAEDMAAIHPTTVFEALNDLPQFAGSRNATAQPNTAGGNNTAINALNLRNIGPLRTLVLYDGHRLPSTNQDGLVDINQIPQMLLQRVDIVTGGTSAVYGSDAIAGVVNFVTDRKFNGVKVNLQGGVSTLRDDRSYELGVAFGHNLFDGRGHFEGSFQIHSDDGILHRTDRRLGQGQPTLQGNGTAAAPFFLVEGVRISAYTFGGKITGPATNPLRNLQFATNGVLTPFVNGSTTGLVGNVQIGGDGAYHTAPSLKAAQRMNQGYGRFDFDLTDNTHLVVTAAGSVEHTFNVFINQRIPNVTLSATNGFLPVAYQQQMTAAGISTFTFGKLWSENVVTPPGTDINARQLYVNAGVEGKLGDNYKWEASYGHSSAKQTSTLNANLDNGNLFAALDAVVGPTGQVVCNVSITNPGLYPGCVPLNVFGPTSESQAAIDYVLRRKTQFVGKTTMDDASASITGAPLSTWAGPVKMALSGEWRRLGYEMKSDQQSPTQDPLNCLGLRFNSCTTTPPTAKLGVVQDNRTPVSMDVSEAALEADLPLVKDVPFARGLDLNTAVRYARYSVTGTALTTVPASTRTFNATTWKAGLAWHLNDRVTVRATRSRDFRAPNLNDLFQPGSINTVTFTDLLPVPNPSPTVAFQRGGNPNLQPEVGDTSTLGVVFQPTENFSLSVDGFDIKIRNAITTVNGGQANIQQACYASGGASFYCTLQIRPLGFSNTSPANTVTQWIQVPINIAEQHTYGADVEANYRTQLGDRPLTLRGLATYQPHVIYVQPGVPTFDMAGADFNGGNLQAAPIWRLTTSARYSPIEPLTIDWMTRWRSSLRHNADTAQLVAPGQNHVDAVAFSNINLSWRLSPNRLGQADLYLNVQNVFNQLPPLTAWSGVQNEPGFIGGFAAGDDVVGRYFSLGVRLKL
jgi:outer membrane receptor protein involved in Fe transport